MVIKFSVTFIRLILLFQLCKVAEIQYLYTSPLLLSHNSKAMDSLEPIKVNRHTQILSELLFISITLKIEYVDFQTQTITSKEYKLIGKMKQLIEELEELDTKTS